MSAFFSSIFNSPFQFILHNHITKVNESSLNWTHLDSLLNPPKSLWDILNSNKWLMHCRWHTADPQMPTRWHWKSPINEAHANFPVNERRPWVCNSSLIQESILFPTHKEIKSYQMRALTSGTETSNPTICFILPNLIFKLHFLMHEQQI